MFGRSKLDKVKEQTRSGSALAAQLARDRRFRKRMKSALEHGARARRLARRRSGVAGTLSRLAADQALRAELKSTRDELQRAYERLEKKRRRNRRRTVLLVLGAASLAARRDVRNRVTGSIPGFSGQGESVAEPEAAPTPAVAEPSAPETSSQPLEDLTKEELYARAQQAKIPGRSEMSKEQLIAALRANG
jgi:hypothetical protein